MKKLKLVFNLITLTLTTGLLVMITVAWYAVNKTANVIGGVGRIADMDKIIDTVEYYNFESVASDKQTYRVKNYVYTSFGSHPDQYQINFTYDNGHHLISASDTQPVDFSMNPYDYLSKDITKYLIKITLLEGKGYSSLQFLSTSNYFIGFYNGAGDGSVSSVDSLSMSSVIKFGCYDSNYPVISASGGHDNAEVVLTAEPTYSHFEYTNNSIEYYGAITAPKKTIGNGATPANSSSQLELYILIDYNLDALNAFYSYNLATSGDWGTEGHGQNIAPQFITKDFTILILG